MSAEQTLFDLVSEAFPKLSQAEKKMLQNAVKGTMADCRGEPDDDKEPKNSVNWGEERHIRSELVRWLCTTQSVRSLIDPKGIQIQYAKVTGKLDLAFVMVCFPLIFDHCAIPEGIDLSDAETRLLDYSGTWSGPIFGGGLTVHGDLWLCDGFQVNGEVCLIDARIKGVLNCGGGRFCNRGGVALSADRVTVAGSLFLDKGFQVNGEVCLLGAHITGQLSCRGGWFRNRDGLTLCADEATVGGSVFLNDGFWSYGEVSLLGATIKGELYCRGGRFLNPNRNALSANGVTVERDIILNGEFRSYGEICLLGANIKGVFNCRGGWFLNPNRNALSADDATVGGSVFLADGFWANGDVRLPGATIKGEFSCRGGQFLGRGTCQSNPHRVSLNAHGIEVEGDVYLDKGFRTKSGVSLVYASVGRLVDDCDCWPQQGNLNIQGLVYTTIEPADVETRLKWLERQPSTPFYPQPYEQFAQFLRRIGHETDAKRVAIARENARLKQGDLPCWSRLWKQVLRYTIRHGYMPGWALAWMLGIVLFGGILFCWGDTQGLMTPAKEPVYKSDASQPAKKLAVSYQTLNPWVYSLDAFLPIINLHQQDTGYRIQIVNANFSSRNVVAVHSCVPIFGCISASVGCSRHYLSLVSQVW
jgi:hypothetical protein